MSATAQLEHGQEQSIYDSLAEWFGQTYTLNVLTSCMLLLVDDRLAVAVNNCRVQYRIATAAVTAGQVSSKH